MEKIEAHWEEEGGKSGYSYSHLIALSYSELIVWRERKQFRGEKKEKNKGQG